MTFDQATSATTPGRFELSTADPRFDPFREVWVNGWAFRPVGRRKMANGAIVIDDPRAEDLRVPEHAS